MTRAMTLIKMNFVGSLRALSSEVIKPLSEKVARSSVHCPFLHVDSLDILGRVTYGRSSSPIHSI